MMSISLPAGNQNSKAIQAISSEIFRAQALAALLTSPAGMQALEQLDDSMRVALFAHGGELVESETVHRRDAFECFADFGFEEGINVHRRASRKKCPNPTGHARMSVVVAHPGEWGAPPAETVGSSKGGRWCSNEPGSRAWTGRG